MFSRAQLTAKPLHCFMATRASVYNLPTKQACAFEDSTASQPAPATPRGVPELPKTGRVSRHKETAKKRAKQECQVQTEKDTVEACSTTRCARDDGVCGFHHVFARSNGDGS